MAGTVVNTQLGDLPVELIPLLERLAKSCEELLLAGLTTACETTQQALSLAAQEASRKQVLRLASTLRIAGDELGRFVRKDPEFSQKRLTFFLNRTWLLARGLTRALKSGDRSAYQRFQWSPQSVVVPRIEVVTLGISKKIATNAFVAFDFRLRLLAPLDVGDVHLPVGSRLVWSSVFPLKPNSDIPAEAHLHLPQKQKFPAILFAEKRQIVVENAAVVVEKNGPARIQLANESKVTAGDSVSDWTTYLGWDMSRTQTLVATHQVSPFDLEIELHDEISLDQWMIGAPTDRDGTGVKVYPIQSKGLEFDIVVPRGSEGEALAVSLEGLRNRPTCIPIFGLLHFELCRFVFQPLAVFGDDGPTYVMLSPQTFKPAQLLKLLKF